MRDDLEEEFRRSSRARRPEPPGSSWRDRISDPRFRLLPSLRAATHGPAERSPRCARPSSSPAARPASAVPPPSASSPAAGTSSPQCASPPPTPIWTDLPSERAMARNLRRWLWKANVRRPELHVGTPTRKALTWHDLRATGATWMAVRGDDPLKIKQRCGHRTFSTTELYVREAEAVREGFGDPFPALPAALLGIAPNRPGRFSRSRSSQKQAVLGGVDGTRRRVDGALRSPAGAESRTMVWRRRLAAPQTERGGRDSNASRKCPQNIGNYAGSCARGASSIAPTRDRSRPLATSRDQSMDDIRVRTRSRPGRRCDRRPLGDCGGPCSRGDAKAQERRPGRRLILKAAVRYGRPANPREQGKLRPRPSRSSLA